MSHLLLRLSLGLLLVGGCKAQVVVHRREARSEKLVTWAIGPDQQRLLAIALYRAGRIREPDWALLPRFYYYPVVTNRRGEGLYNVTRFTHERPIGVLRSTQGLSTVEMGLTDAAMQDSVAAAFIPHGDRFNHRLRQAIVDEYRQYFHHTK